MRAWGSTRPNKTFRDEFLHLATRVLTHIRQQCTGLMPSCVEKLESAATAMRRGCAIGHLTSEPSVELLQVLAGAPCLISGHEMQNCFPAHCKPQHRNPEEGAWVFFDNVIPNDHNQSSCDVIKTVQLWLEALGSEKAQDLTPWDESRSVLWLAANGEKPHQGTVQVLSQWARRQRFVVSTDGMMSWSTILPRRNARLTHSLLDGVPNPGTPQKQCLVMCQSFHARRGAGSALKCVRGDSAHLLPPGFRSAAWILCSLWGQFQLRFWRHGERGEPIAYELQAQADHRPDVLAVPLCGASVLSEDDFLENVNTCRRALNSFLCCMTQEAQTRVTGAFQSLQTFVDTCSIVKPAMPVDEGPATFIGPGRVPNKRSDVIMPDIAAAAWGLSPLRRFTQEEMDEIGSTAIDQVIEMLQKGVTLPRPSITCAGTGKGFRGRKCPRIYKTLVAV